MAIDFFQSQEAARRRTAVLVLLFVLAVVATMVMVYVAVSLVVLFAGRGGGPLEPSTRSLLHPGLLGAVGSSTLAVIGAGSGYKIMQLRSGGAAVAESLGGRLVEPGTGDLAERRLLNVVQEMAIASGLPVPVVYLLERERGINAFAAGHGPTDAVIGVTRGAIDGLTRDELQGVIGHEFSHILNGDMRLNVRLMGWLHGILVVGLLGTILLRNSFRVPLRSRKGGSAGMIILLGAALLVVGYVGTFFGKLIKAAVSRQREYLADAAAVQFTRHPAGLAAALRKIATQPDGSRLRSDRAEEASHMYFAQGVSVYLDAFFATHPPLVARIRRLDPSWDGRVLEEASGETPVSRPAPPPDTTEAWPFSVRTASALAVLAEAVADVGQLTEEHLRYAGGLIESLPEDLRDAATDPFAARAVVCALLLDDDPEVRSGQDSRLESIDPPLAELTRRLSRSLRHVEVETRLPLIELAMPSLRRLSPAQYDGLRSAMRALGGVERRRDLFRWMLERLVRHTVDPTFTGVSSSPVRYESLDPLIEPCSLLLSTLARVGHRDEDRLQTAFQDGAARLPVSGLRLLPRDACSIPGLDAALDQLTRVAPRLKRAVLEACAATVAADERVTVREAELLRAVAASLGCPMPPLLPGQPLLPGHSALLMGGR